VRAERSLMHALEGGCQVPIAGYARVIETPDRQGVDQLLLRAFVGSVDGTKAVRGELAGPAQAPEGLGAALADDLLAHGADQILAEVRGVA
jgi:hydroxymethylbilane synthase